MRPFSKEQADSILYLLGRFAAARETPQSLVSALWQIEVEDLPADYYQRRRSVAGQNARLTDSGLAKLELLARGWTQVTDAGVAKLQEALPKLRVPPLGD